jgi:hypothetical protein
MFEKYFTIAIYYYSTSIPPPTTHFRTGASIMSAPAVKRSPSAYALFTKDKRAAVKAENPGMDYVVPVCEQTTRN